MLDWEARYRKKETPWELGGPSPPLVDLVALFRQSVGRALVPGCGRGDDALYVASLGADVTGWDVSATAIGAATNVARERGLSVTFALCDALAVAPSTGRTFDTWIEHTFFCALPRELRQHYVESAAALLRPGGLILGIFLIGDDTQGPPYGTSAEELRALFTPRFHLVSLTQATNSPGMWAGREVAVVMERRAQDAYPPPP